MGLFSDIGGLFGGGDAPQFNPQTVQLDPAMLAQFQQDIGGVRDVAQTPVSGLSSAGFAGQNLAQQAYANQLQDLQRQQGSQLATGMAGVGRFGGDSGAAERMAGNIGRQGLLGEQQLGGAAAQNLANIGFQDLQQQQANQFNALMALPQLSASPLQMQTAVSQGNVGIQNQAQLANMAAEQAQSDKLSGLLGTAGGLAGAYFGGPLGAGAGQAGGQMLGGLFS